MIEKDTLLIIDGYNFIYRAYYVMPQLSLSDGSEVGAVYGFTLMMLRILKNFQPSYLLLALDSSEKSFRYNIYSQYKAHRKPMPDELKKQLSIIYNAAKVLNIPIIEKIGYEADDLIATIVNNKFDNFINQYVIISSDKDLLQLLSKHVKVFNPIENKYITNNDIIDKFGVTSDKIKDVMTLSGDRADNIPGVKGIGVKIASSLIRQFGSVDNLLNSMHLIKNIKQRESLLASIDVIELSSKLLELKQDIPLCITLENLVYKPPTKESIKNFIQMYNFTSLFKKFSNTFNMVFENFFLENSNVELLSSKEIINDNIAFNNILAKAQELGRLVFFHEETSEFIYTFYLVGEMFFYFKINLEENNNKDLFNKFMLSLLEDISIQKITFRFKLFLKFLNINEKLKLNACIDLEIMHYSLYANSQFINLLGYKSDDTNANNNNKAEKICVSLLRYYHLYEEELRKNNVLSLYKDIDQPLCYVLFRIEKNGIKINLKYLKELSDEFNQKIAILQKGIFNITTTEFNILSTQQLGRILFEKLQLPYEKKNLKKEKFSTNIEILEKLRKSGHIIADLIIKWRHLVKLKNVYIEGLQKYVNLSTERIHTTLSQISTITGRLSSYNPNLQNIPIKSQDGSKIRAAFVAESGKKLISADYSQIELRILSDIADVPQLKKALSQGEDLHTQTACNVFKISKNQVTSEHRNKAKAINFGIIYGISDFGLAKQLDISTSEAASYKKVYFSEYPNILLYIEKIKNYARKHGYVKNLFERKCFIKGINDKNITVRKIAERSAINAPIQSTSADIIKVAMINIDKTFEELQLKTKMILQIHDELLFESPIEEVDVVLPIIKKIMKEASILSISAEVQIKIGINLSLLQLQ